MTQAQKDVNAIERLRDEEKSPFVEQLICQAVELFEKNHPTEVGLIKMLKDEIVLPRVD